MFLVNDHEDVKPSLVERLKASAAARGLDDAKLMAIYNVTFFVGAIVAFSGSNGEFVSSLLL